MPGDGENTALRTTADGLATSVPSIDFSSVITATDKDGDRVVGAAEGKFTIAVQDDVPVAEPEPNGVSASVEGDGMASTVAPELSGLDGNDQSIGNKEGGDSDTDDEAAGTAGSLSGLFSVGAGETLGHGGSLGGGGLPTPGVEGG